MADAGWIEAGDGYAIALRDGEVVCRNAKGKVLASVPKAVAQGEAAQQLESLCEWLGAHERECMETVETWMLRSLPVPRAVLESIFVDPAWRAPLENAIVDADDVIGLLRDVDAKKGVGVVDLDGETRWLRTETIALPHPILIEDLNGFRELATELSLTQKIQQLFRETWPRPADLDPRGTKSAAFAEGKFEQLLHALSRCRKLGYRVRGGFACCPVWEGGRLCEARYWIGSDSPEAETYTGDLVWVDEREHGLELGQVGAVAYSEGVRMASAIYAGRVVPKEGEAQ